MASVGRVDNFFRQLCAKELSRVVISDMEKVAPVLLCKLEKIFPPAFFNPMQHLLLHLPYEARMGGAVQYRWCYPIERCQKVLRTKCKNNCKIEASSAELYILRRCQTSQSNTMVTIFPVCIIHPLVTMLAIMNRVSASFEDNLEV